MIEGTPQERRAFVSRDDERENAIVFDQHSGM
jgi:hypothetical protein